MAGAALTVFFRAAPLAQRYQGEGHIISTLGSAYVIGTSLSFAACIWASLAPLTLRQIAGLPRNRATTSARSLRARLVGWTLSACAVLVCASPDAAYAALKALPTEEWHLAVQHVLPFAAVLATSIIQPKIAQTIYRHSGRCVCQVGVLTLAGFVSWIFSLLVTALMSENCYGLRWSFLTSATNLCLAARILQIRAILFQLVIVKTGRSMSWVPSR